MALSITPHGRNWAVHDGADLVCLTVYKKGAAEVVRRLETITNGHSDADIQEGKGHKELRPLCRDYRTGQKPRCRFSVPYETGG